MDMNATKIPNTNNKLQCQVFAHIFPAPAKLVGETLLKQERDIIPEDCDLPPFRACMITMLRCKLKEVWSVVTYHSDGVDSPEFITRYLQAKHGSSLESEVAVCYFRKV